MLGCGSVGSRSPGCCWNRPTTSSPGSGAPRARRHRRTPARPRARSTSRRAFHHRAHALVTRGDIDVVIEVIGGIEPARSLILAALESGACVVTANKALLAEDGPPVRGGRKAAGEGRDIYFEAAVAGAIPIIRPLRESLAGDRVHACSASSTAPPTTSSTRWTPPAGASRRHSRTRRSSATPRPTRPPTSRASTPQPRRRSSPAWPSTPGSPRPTSTARASPRSPPPTCLGRRNGSVVKLLAISELAPGDGAV